MVTPLIVAGVLSSTGTVSAVFAVLTLGTAIVLAIWIYATKEMARLPLDQSGVTSG